MLLESVDDLDVGRGDLVLDRQDPAERQLVPRLLLRQAVEETAAGHRIDVGRRLGDHFVGRPERAGELEQPVQVTEARLRRRPQHLLGDVLDDPVGHLVGDARDPRRQDPAGVIRDAVVVLPGPGDQVFLGGLALLCALHPIGLIQRAAGSLQLVAHLVNEHLTVKCHGTRSHVRERRRNQLVPSVRTVSFRLVPSRNQDAPHGHLPSRTRRGSNSRSRALCRVLHRSVGLAGGRP